MTEDEKQKVVITGIGCWTGLGHLNQTWDQLRQGKSNIFCQQPFPELSSYPLSLITDKPLSLSDLILPVVKAALIDAELAPPLPDCGVVVGSSRACQGEIEKFAQGKINSTNWLNFLPNQGAIATAHILGSQSAVLSPMAACSTGIWSIAQGYQLITSGQCSQVVAGALETPITPLTLAGFAKMGALAKTGCYPFDIKREGLVLGEGGAIFVLESLASAQARKAQIYGELIGFGFSCDAYHVSAPNPDYDCACLAIKKSLEMSKISPDKIDFIHAHGTSTQLNDAREAQLIQSLFPHDVAVSSTKGATGHTLGASGVIALAVTLMALQTQTLPPCVGLRESEFDLHLVQQARQRQINTALVLSFGFGGQNGAMIVRK